jgi:hypothetical protein
MIDHNIKTLKSCQILRAEKASGEQIYEESKEDSEDENMSSVKAKDP